MRNREQPVRDSRELLRARLQGIEQRLQIAARESEGAGLSHMATLIVASADQVRSLLNAAALPPTFRVEAVIGRAQQTHGGWASHKAV
jgi:hypothetical protein